MNKTQRMTRQLRAKGFTEEEIKVKRGLGSPNIDPERAREIHQMGGSKSRPPQPSAVRGFENDN